MTFRERSNTIYIYKEYGQGQLGMDPLLPNGKLYIRNWRKEARFLINGLPCIPSPTIVGEGPATAIYELDLSENKNVHLGFNHVACGFQSFRLEIRRKGVETIFFDGQFGKFIPVVFREDEIVKIMNERGEPSEIGKIKGDRIAPIKIGAGRKHILNLDRGVYSLIRERGPAPILPLESGGGSQIFVEDMDLTSPPPPNGNRKPHCQ